MHRRQFLAWLGGVAAVLAVTPAQGSQRASRQLVVIDLVGGNDSLNTFIPYRDPEYLKLRPSLAIRDGIPLTDRVALHPALSSWQSWMEEGSLAIVQNVHYPQPSLSHFRSRDVWQSGEPKQIGGSGWLGRYLESIQAPTQAGVFLGEEYPLAMMGAGTHYLHLAPNLLGQSSLRDQVLQQLYQQPQASPLAEEVRRTVIESQRALAQLRQELERSPQTYPKTDVGSRLSLVGRLVRGGVPIVYTTVGGWDTHARQGQRHQFLLSRLGEGVTALRQDLEQAGLGKQVTILIYSEFGRRPTENGNAGTDHGTAGALMLIRSSLKAGVYGGDPALDSLVNGNLPMQIDFRQVYSEILTWLGGNPESILGESFQPLGILI